MKRTLLLSSKAHNELCAQIASSFSLFVEQGEISWDQFDDGFNKTTIRNVENVMSRDVCFLASFEKPEDIFEQLSVLYALPHYGAWSLKVVLPFFSTGTMDRVQVPGEIATAKTMTRVLSAIPPSCRVEIVTYDIHALQEWHYFGDNVVVRPNSAMPLLKAQLASIPDVSIAFPDDGAYKRFGNMFDEFPQITCEKIRKGTERIVRIVTGDPKNRHVVVVDDLVMTGTTLEQCARVLQAQGASAVSVYCTHGVFPKYSWNNFVKYKATYKNIALSNFWVTDSCPSMIANLTNVEPFRVLSLAPLIGEMLRDDCGR